MNNERIVFMGTPDFAVASLDALVNAGFNIVGVVTAPDKPAGRGMKQTASAVKQYALSKGLHLLQPEKLKNPDFLQELQSLQADLQVVVAFRMLPEVVWNMPPLGTINVHGSLLPQYRGAAPINWAIINGEIETGVTTFQLQHAIDTGHILMQSKLPIAPNETAGELHDRMKELGADLLIQTLQQLLSNHIAPQPQQELITANHATTLHHAPKIFTETCRINFSQPVDSIHNLIRGLSPFPGAFTTLHQKTLKIYRSHPEKVAHQQEPGSVSSDGKTFLRFSTPDGFVYATELQMEGKKRMTVQEFLRGYRMPENDN